MVRLRVVLVGAVLSFAATGEAQQTTFTGTITAHAGAAHGGDVRGRPLTLGASMAVVDDRGVGAELDVAHTGDFDPVLFADSSVTSVMLNVIGMYPHEWFQPFVNVGAGVLRLRTAIFQGQELTGRTDVAFNAGAGLQVMFDELLGVRGDVRYFRYFQHHADLPLIDGGLFDYWRTSIGVTLAWPIR